MNCHEVREIVFLVTDNEAGQEVVVSFRQHLETCPECARQAQYLQRLLMLVRQRCCRVSAPARLRLRILSSVRQTGDWTEDEL